MDNTKLIEIFDKQAKRYEKRRRAKAQRKWREKLLADAGGKVLEIAVGAGGNFAFYPSDVEITAIDFSPQMLEKAKAGAAELGIKAEFMLADIEQLDFPEHSFDTIVSTLSLCGYRNPQALLNKLSRWCKPEGLILMMEHGISSNPLYKVTQKAVDPLAYKLAGCYGTRDILGLLDDSNLNVMKSESYLLNTVHLIWAKPAIKA